jgi:hypothetical protein
VSVQRAGAPAPAAPSGTARPLTGRGLGVARGAGAGLIGLLLGLFVLALPARLLALEALAGETRRALDAAGPTTAPLLALAFQPALTPGVMLALEIALMAALTLSGGMIFASRSHDRTSIFAAVTLVAYGALMSPALDALQAADPRWQAPVRAAQVLGLICSVVLFFITPDGRFVPRVTLALTGVWALWALTGLLAPGLPLNLLNARPHTATLGATPPVWFLLDIGWYGVGVAAQVYRYWRVSTPAQRRQTKWVVGAAAAAVLIDIALVLPRLTWAPLSQPGLPDLFYRGVAAPLVLAGLLPMPLVIVFAILRYHLWNVEVIVNRAMVYGLLSGALALTYAGSIVVIRSLLRPFTTNDELAVVTSTLACAALFSPLRGRIQAIIDRRFYRRHYDAARTLARFSAELREEVDLNTLISRLEQVVVETMEPRLVSLWLAAPDAPGDPMLDAAAGVGAPETSGDSGRGYRPFTSTTPAAPRAVPGPLTPGRMRS